MPGRINDDDIQALRERADLGAIAGDYTALKRAGSKLKGLCPFHSEKTPSFTVDAARGFFHCFGCGEGGDVYGFLQKIEALSFPEAVERLARIEGYTLRYEQLSPGQRRALGRRTRLSECVAEAAAFFRGQLAGDEGAAAREYLGRRGLDAATVEHFRIGWAPDSWDRLVGHLQQAGFTTQEVVDAGLASRGQRGLIDRFRGRVVFPILEASGRDVVAFGGRVLPDAPPQTTGRDGQAPKYINSSETDVYKKSRTLYGLNWARAEIQRRDSVLVVEGYMDVIGLHTADVRHAVATCGTALTAEHFRQLEKFCRRVVLALDADEAGFAAADRARELAQEVGIREVGVLPLPVGQDPADLAAAGRDAVDQAFGGVQTAVEFQIGHLLRGAELSTPEGQVAAYRRTFPLLATMSDRVLRFRYLRDIVSPIVHISPAVMERELDEAAGPAVGQRQWLGSTPADQPSDKLPLQLQRERWVLQAALQFPELLANSWSDLTVDDFTADTSRQLFLVLQAVGLGDLDAVLAKLADDDIRARVRALALDDTFGLEESGLTDLVKRLRAAAIQRENDEIRQRLERTGEPTDPEERQRLKARQHNLELRQRELLEGRRG